MEAQGVKSSLPIVSSILTISNWVAFHAMELYLCPLDHAVANITKQNFELYCNTVKTDKNKNNGKTVFLSYNYSVTKQSRK